MKILEIRLVNVKSYEDETIRFQPGVNFISGINGAGKTTIIESIGFVLFDYLPYPVKQFIREGKRSGEIQLLFEARDERLYRIMRKFGHSSKSVKWEAYDEETGAVLDELHGISDMHRWIKETVGIDPGDDLSKMYSQVIAVEQGLFTAPFLETPGNRRSIFERILKVEGYRQAFTNSRSLVTFVEGEKKTLGVEIDALSAELEKLPALEEQLDAVQQRMLREGNELAQQEAKYTDAERIESGWSKLKEEMESSQSRETLLGERLNSLNEKSASLESQRIESQAASQVVEKTAKAYNRYLETQEQLRVWDAKKSEKDQLTNKRDSLEKYYENESAKIGAESEGLRKTEEELAEEIKTLTGRAAQTKGVLQGMDEDLKKISDWAAASEAVKTGCNQIEEWISKSEEIAGSIRSYWQQVEGWQSDISERQKDIVGLSDWEQQYEKGLASLSLEQVLTKKSTLKARREVLLQNQEYLKQGTCPIIGEACPSHKVSGDLRQYFSHALEELSADIANCEELEKQERKRQDELAKLSSKIQVAKRQAQDIAKQEQRCKDFLESLYRGISKIDLAVLSELIDESREQQSRLVETSESIRQWIAEKDWVDSSLSQFAQQPPASSDLDVQDVSLPAEVRQETTTLAIVEQWLSAWEVWVPKIKCWLNAEKDLAEKYDAWVRTVSQSANIRYEGVKRDYQHLCTLLTQNQDKLQALDPARRKLEKRRQELEQPLQDIEKLKAQLIQYEGVEETILSLKRQLEEDQPYFQLYTSNKQTADRLEQITADLKTNEEAKQKASDDLDRIRTTLARLSSEYDGEKHKALKDELKQMLESIASLRTSLRQMDVEVQRVSNERDVLLLKQQTLSARIREAKVKERTLELASVIRTVLRDAADPIAQVYRQHLSLVATTIYRQITNENVQVDWAEEYELQLKDNHRGSERTRVFKQLSGGEQMAAALAVRLALMQTLSDVKLGFFDEPTTNLDSERRHSLALAIQSSTEDFDQLFVISHDDAFDALTENTIVLMKDQGNGAKLMG